MLSRRRCTSYRLWIDQAELLPRKVELLDESGSTLKLLLLDDYETVAGHATARKIELLVPRKDRRSVFLLSEVRYDAGVRDEAFSLARLNRGR